MLFYVEQRWTCNACGAHGVVLFYMDDSRQDEEERLHQSHREQKSVRECPTPLIVRVISRTVQYDAP